MKTDIDKIKRKVRRILKDIPPDQMKLILNDIADLKKRNLGLGNKIWIRLLTGGYWSQGLDAFVMREMGKQAGWIKEPWSKKLYSTKRNQIRKKLLEFPLSEKQKFIHPKNVTPVKLNTRKDGCHESKEKRHESQSTSESTSESKQNPETILEPPYRWTFLWKTEIKNSNHMGILNKLEIPITFPIFKMNIRIINYWTIILFFLIVIDSMFTIYIGSELNPTILSVMDLFDLNLEKAMILRVYYCLPLLFVLYCVNSCYSKFTFLSYITIYMWSYNICQTSI